MKKTSSSCKSLPKLQQRHAWSIQLCHKLSYHVNWNPVLRIKMLPPITQNTRSIAELQALFSQDVVLQHPSACMAAMNNDDTFSVIWDSGASMCISGDKQEFIGKIKPLNNAVVKGIVSGLKIEGIGRVRWSVLDTEGKLWHLMLPAYYVPKTWQRLLCTSVFCKEYPKNTISIEGDTWVVENNQDDQSQSSIDVYINPFNNLPTSTCFQDNAVKQIAVNFSQYISATHKNNFNLSEPHKERLCWHYQLGHIGTKTVQFILQTRVLASSDRQKRLHTRAANIPLHDIPKCGSWMFSKQSCKWVPGKVSKVVKDREGILSADKLHPGQQVFIDHFICSTRGRRIKGYGIKSRSKVNSYCGGCIFVNASTGYMHAKCQQSTSSHYTLEGVNNFEKIAYNNGIIIQEYQSDNGVAFTSKEFRAHQEE